MIKEYKQACAVVDTSAFIKHPLIVSSIKECFKYVVIPEICVKELSRIKDKNRRQGIGNNAWLALGEIKEHYRDNIFYSDEIVNGNNDQQIIAVANHFANECPTYIITDDIDFSVLFKKGSTITPNAFISEYDNYKLTLNNDPLQTRILEKKNINDANTFKLNNNLNPNSVSGKTGFTLLIDAVRKGELEKVKLYVKSGANLDLTDSSKYFLTPLSHAVQCNHLEVFDFLIKSGADINKGSINESDSSHTRARNEGNTPLMIACWHGRKNFVERLLKEKGLCLNQQDANGYTALIKCAIKKNKELYDLLLKQEKTDPLIRDRKNHDAAYYMEQISE